MKKLLQLAALLTLTAFFLPVLTVGFPIRAAEAGEEGLLPVAGTAEARLETAAETELRQPSAKRTRAWTAFPLFRRSSSPRPPG